MIWISYFRNLFFQSLSLSDPGAVLEQVFTCVLVFLGLGVFILIGAINQTYFFTRAGANLTQRVRYINIWISWIVLFLNCLLWDRSMTFKAMLKQECAWFDDRNHSPGALGSRLTGDAANIQTVWKLLILKFHLNSIFNTIIVGHWLSTEFNIASNINVCNRHYRFIYFIGEIDLNLSD